MEALIVNQDQPGQVTFVRDHPLPQRGADDVLIRVHLAGICATDLEIVRGYLDFTGVPGHEFSGTVIEGPEELLGKRVVAEINCVCHDCDMCRRGLETHCRMRTVVGISGRDGAFATHVVVPARNCHIVPAGVSDEQAVFVEPLAAALQIPRHCPIDPRMRVTVIGSGRLGLLVGQVLARYHCRLTLVGRNPKSLALAKKFELDTLTLENVKPAADQDVVVECSGAPDGLALALRLVRPRGTIVLKSTYAQPEPIDLAPLVINEIRLLGNRCGPFRDALQMLERGFVDVEPLISAAFALSDGPAAFEAAARPGMAKVLLKPGDH